MTTSTVRPASPFRRPEFRRLTIGWCATNLGDSALYLVLAIWVRELTGSEALGAAVFIALGAPAVLAPFAGHIADRVRRKPLLIATNLGAAAAVSLLLVVRDARDVWLIFVVTFLYGTASYLTSAAQSGLLRDLLDDDEIGTANGTFSSIDNGMRIISPALGTALYVAAGAGAVALVSIAGFVTMAVVLFVTRFEESEPEAAGNEPYWRELTAGFRSLFAEPMVRVLALSLAAAVAATGFLNATVFPLVEVSTGSGPAALGPLQAVQGVGALFGGLLSAPVMRRIGERRLVTIGLWGLAAGCAIALAVVVWPSPGVIGWSGISAAQAVIGLAVPWIIVGTATYRMKVTAPRLQGRSSAALNVLANVPQMMLLALGASLLAVADFRWFLLISLVGVVGAALYCGLARVRPALER